MTRTLKKTKAWKRSSLGIKTGAKGEPKKRILIVCEGEKTEPNYFNAFRVTSATVVVIGLGRNTKELVSKAIEIKENEIKSNTPFEAIWCVFDRDSFTSKDFNNALKMARDNQIKVAYSNEAFEVWYLLHFNYFHTGVSRNLYVQKLTKCLDKPYKKNSKSLYDELLPKQHKAIQYAKKLLQSYSKVDPAINNPSTTVFELVEELNKNL